MCRPCRPSHRRRRPWRTPRPLRAAAHPHSCPRHAVHAKPARPCRCTPPRNPTARRAARRRPPHATPRYDARRRQSPFCLRHSAARRQRCPRCLTCPICRAPRASTTSGSRSGTATTGRRRLTHLTPTSRPCRRSMHTSRPGGARGGPSRRPRSRRPRHRRMRRRLRRLQQLRRLRRLQKLRRLRRLRRLRHPPRRRCPCVPA